MKKTLNFILAAVMALTVLSSCDKWLEEVNYGNPTTEDMMTNEANVTLLVGQAYSDLCWIHDHWGYWGVASLTSDECVCPVRNPDENWADGGYWKKLNTHQWNEFADAFKNVWNCTIAGAVLCNKLIDTLNQYKDSMSETTYKEYLGEMEVLRCYYFYLLFDCFGRVPYLEEYKEVNSPLLAPEETWSYLVACMEKNAPNMKVVNDGNRAQLYGRTTQGFAYALLARMYLNAESFGCTPQNVFKTVDAPATMTPINSTADFYTNAVRCCDAVIESGSYKIEPDFFNNFKIDNSGSKENIFVLVEDGSAEFDLRYSGSMSSKLRITLLTHNYCMQSAYGMIEKPWNGFCARPAFLARYNEKDVRGPGYELNGTKNKHQWGWFVGPICDANGNQLKDENNDPAIITKEFNLYTSPEGVTSSEEVLMNCDWNSGARMNKYELDVNGKYAYTENDFVLFRYADVLWMKEEAILRGGSGTSSYGSADFKTLRDRSFAYDGGEADYAAAYPTVLTLDGILDERGREFAWENVRRRDLIRFGKFGDATYVDWVASNDTKWNWFPIPYSVLEKSVRDENGNPIWTQNPGY